MLTLVNVIMSKFWDVFYRYKGNKDNKWELCNFLNLTSVNLPRNKRIRCQLGRVKIRTRISRYRVMLKWVSSILLLLVGQ